MPKISIKSPEEIAVMGEAGEKLAVVLNTVLAKIRPGLCTFEIDKWINDLILQSGGEPSFKRVPGYHWASCTGINAEVVHSIPKKEKIIKEGDILKIDAGVYWKGFHSDASRSVIVKAEESRNKFINEEKFLQAGRVALKEAIKISKPGKTIGDISKKIQEAIEGADYTPVKQLTGHGIGRQLHEEPLIPCFLNKRLEKTEKIVPGMVLAIEVIYNYGKADLIMQEDGWTISTKDGKISGLFEETIAVTKNGPQILTEVRERN